MRKDTATKKAPKRLPASPGVDAQGVLLPAARILRPISKDVACEESSVSEDFLCPYTAWKRLYKTPGVTYHFMTSKFVLGEYAHGGNN